MNVDVICFFKCEHISVLTFFPISPLFYSSSYVSISFITWIVLEGIIILYVSLSQVYCLQVGQTFLGTNVTGRQDHLLLWAWHLTCQITDIKSTCNILWQYTSHFSVLSALCLFVIIFKRQILWQVGDAKDLSYIPSTGREICLALLPERQIQK